MDTHWFENVPKLYVLNAVAVYWLVKMRLGLVCSWLLAKARSKVKSDTHDHLCIELLVCARILFLFLCRFCLTGTIHFNAFQCHCTINVPIGLFVRGCVCVCVFNIIGSLFFDNIIGTTKEQTITNWSISMKLSASTTTKLPYLLWDGESIHPKKKSFKIWTQPTNKSKFIANKMWNTHTETLNCGCCFESNKYLWYSRKQNEKKKK